MGLPSGYTQLAYVRSTGTQCFNTGFKHNHNTRVVMHLKPTSITANAWAFEGRISSSNAAKGVFFYYSSSNLWCADYSSSSNRQSFQGISPTDELYIDFNKNVLTINGTSVTFPSTTFQSTADLVLLANNTAGNISGYLCADIFPCQVYDNDTLVRDYVPCVSPSGDVGLYDTINNKLCDTAGTGAFIAGPAVGPQGSRTLLNAVDYRITTGNALIYAVSYKIKKGRAMVNGIVYDIPLSGGVLMVGELSVGSTVKMNVNGVATEFIVVHQGKPSSIYDDSCNGAWLLQKLLGAKMRWTQYSDNNYQNSVIHSYSGEYLNLFDAGVKAMIKTVKIPYRAGSNGSLQYGANGLTTQIFSLSAPEVHYESADIDSHEGAVLDYFASCSTTSADAKRIALDNNGNADTWALRSPSLDSRTSVMCVKSNGNCARMARIEDVMVRPALILPNDACIDSNFNVIA